MAAAAVNVPTPGAQATTTVYTESDVATLRELFPDLPRPVIVRALKANDGDVSRSTGYILEHFSDLSPVSHSPASANYNKGFPAAIETNNVSYPDIISPTSADMINKLLADEEAEKQRREKEERETADLIRKMQLDDANKFAEEARANEELIRKLQEEEAAEIRRREQESEEATRKLLEAESAARQAELDKKEYECLICYVPHTIDEIYTLDNCYHRFGWDCLKGYFTSKINDGVTKEIKCAMHECDENVTYEEIRHLVSRETFAKYEDFLLRDTLSADPDVRFCPRPNCGVATISNPNNPMIVCTSDVCNFTYCRNCAEEWHAEFTCDQYQAWKIENNEADARFAAWAEMNTKKCPNCNSFIEKNGGCNHMTCKKCKHEFCWLCMAQYHSGHFRDTDCEQFT